jgi:hypothetical protein
MMKDIGDSALLTFPASLADRSLAVIEANVNVDGLGPAFGESGFTIEDAKMLWDTGAQSTIIPKEILSHSFQEFLKKSVPDEYRSVNGFRVQVDIAIAFTELSLPLVVPKARLPNAFEGIIFRQKGCIDRLVYREKFSRLS